jgi:hypothetical protein
VHTNANASLIAGYGYAGILVSFIARHNPIAIDPGRDPVRRLRRRRQPAAAPARPARRVGAGAAGHRLRADPRERSAARRRLEAAGERLRAARCTPEPSSVPRRSRKARRARMTTILLAFLAAIVGGALRVGVPFLFVSLGECLTEKSGRINLGLEGVLVCRRWPRSAART